MSNDKQTNLYWKKNILYLALLLGVWFIVSYGFSIVFANSLNSVKIGGFKLGFWFAQQGSIYIYLVLIAIYVFLMNRLDKEFNVEEK